mmetsp:Transcript_7467/g.14774  ORF Transcript_7467/g.14774 Transcript_7467/m.14774 type:complete len:490 (-) Transcript_7467:344-1813(-)
MAEFTKGAMAEGHDVEVNKNLEVEENNSTYDEKIDNSQDQDASEVSKAEDEGDEVDENDNEEGDEEDEDDEEDDEDEDEEDEEDDDDDLEVELGFFESDVEEEDEDGDDDKSEDDGQPLILHEDGNWLRWDDGMAGGEGPNWLVEGAQQNVKVEDLACPCCKDPMSFFLQVYAPLDGENFEHAYHRTLYVFVCRKPDCKAPAKVYRAQLPIVNDFYAEECGDEDEEVDIKVPRANPPNGGLELGPSFAMRKRIVTEPEPKKGAPKCGYCGRGATAKCVACKSVYYCCREHQKKHWKTHKATCKILRNMPAHLRPDSDDAAANNSNKAEAEQDPDEIYGRAGDDDPKLTQRALANIAAGKNSQMRKKMHAYDKTFESFQERVGRDPTQCIRYCRWPATNARGAPLWLSSRDRCTDIPVCEHCGAQRKFELQVLPQSLHFLRDLDMDFGTICIYTCSNSCKLDSPESLSPEFAFVQHPDAHCLLNDDGDEE